MDMADADDDVVVQSHEPIQGYADSVYANKPDPFGRVVTLPHTPVSLTTTTAALEPVKTTTAAAPKRGAAVLTSDEEEEAAAQPARTTASAKKRRRRRAVPASDDDDGDDDDDDDDEPCADSAAAAAAPAAAAASAASTTTETKEKAVRKKTSPAHHLFDDNNNCLMNGCKNTTKIGAHSTTGPRLGHWKSEDLAHQHYFAKFTSAQGDDARAIVLKEIMELPKEDKDALNRSNTLPLMMGGGAAGSAASASGGTSASSAAASGASEPNYPAIQPVRWHQMLVMLAIIECGLAVSTFDGGFWGATWVAMGFAGGVDYAYQLFKQLPTLKEIAVSTQMQKIQRAGSMAISADGWKKFGHRILGIVFHVIDRDTGTLNDMLLDVIEVEGEHRAADVGDLLTKAHERFGDNVTLSAVVTDGGNNLLGGAAAVAGEGAVYCAGHKFHLVFDDYEEKTTVANGSSDAHVREYRADKVKLYEFSMMINNSYEKREAFTALQQRLYPKKVPLTLMDFGGNRWSQGVAVLKRYVRLYPVIKLFIEEGNCADVEGGESVAELLPSLARLELYLRVLESVATATTLLEGDKYPMLSLVEFVVSRVKLHLSTPIMCDDAADETVKAHALRTELLCIMNKLNRFGVVPGKPTAAMKAAFFDFRFSDLLFLDAAIRAQVYEAIKIEYKELLELKWRQTQDEEEEEPSDAHKLMWNASAALLAEELQKNAPKVRRALYGDDSMSNVDLSVTYDVLKAYTATDDMRRQAYAFAASWLCIPATEASVERVFSTAKYVFNPLRSRLLNANLEALLIVRAWIMRIFRDEDWSDKVIASAKATARAQLSPNSAVAATQRARMQLVQCARDAGARARMQFGTWMVRLLSYDENKYAVQLTAIRAMLVTKTATDCHYLVDYFLMK